ncbi:MAG: OadG family protein [Lachnospiraceae bacterium]|nr:OadG family protein [Lachnospiraceae bacterium]
MKIKKTLLIVCSMLSMFSLTACGASDASGLTLKEILMKALINTLLGMGTVFIVLILISLIISCFTLISKLQNRSEAKKKAAVEEVKPAVVETIPDEAEEYVDDNELIAVIAAAIAAAEGTSVDGFRVRSIKRSKNNAWKRA